MPRCLLTPPLLVAIAALAFAACDSEPGPAQDSPDTVADTDTPDTGEPDTVDTVQPEPASLRWVIETERGERAETAFTLFPEDEPGIFADTPGFQVSVVATTTGVADGVEVIAERRGAEVGRAKVVTGEDGVGLARIDEFELPDGASSIRLSVVDANGNLIEASRTVEVELAPCEIVVDAPEGCVTEDVNPARPGFQTNLGVRRVSGSCATATIVAYIGDDAGPLTTVELNDTRTVVAVDVTADDTPVGGSVRFDARTTHPNSASLSQGFELIRVLDTEPPTISFVRPDAAVTVLTLAHDADADQTNGLQYALRAAAAGVASENAVQFSVDGVVLEGTSVNAGVWEQTHTFTGDGVATVVAHAVDVCGLTAETELSLPFYASLPRVTVTSPRDGDVLLAKDDADPTTTDVYEVPFNVSIAGTKPGMAVAIECAADTRQGGVWLEIARTDIADPTQTDIVLQSALDVSLLGTHPVCRAVVAWHNRARSTSVELTVALPAPSVALTAPSQNARLNSRAITVGGTALNLEGRMVNVKVIDSGARVLASAVVGPVADGAWNGTINLTPIASVVPDGSYDIAIDAVDQFGNRTSDTQTAPSVRVTLDTTSPVVTLLTPGTHLDPVANTDHLDQRGDIAGYQTTVRVQLQGEVDYTDAMICLATSGQPLGCRPTDADGRVSWAGVTLVPGENTLTLTGRDGYGNDADVVEQTITLALDAPVVEIMSPAAHTVTVDPTVDIVAQVSEPNHAQPVAGATLSLLVNDEEVDAQFIESDSGTYTASGVVLAPGAVSRFQVVATFSGTSGASAERQVRHKHAQPTVSISSPSEGTQFNLDAAACLGTDVDCQTSVHLAVTELESGSEAQLTVNCGDSEPVVTAATADGADTLTFDAVTLAHDSTCAIVAQVTDAAGQVASSAPVSVSVDRRGPIMAFASPAAELLLHADDQRLAREGMQAAFSATVRGVEAGQIATGTLEWLDAETGDPVVRTFTHEIPADVSEASGYTIRFADEAVGSGLIDYPEGVSTVSISLVDAFGNASSISRVVRVETDAPAATISAPVAPVADACTTDADCGAGVCEDTVCHVAWGAASAAVITVNVAGVVTDEDNVRLCSDAVDTTLFATRCQTQGYTQVALASTTGGVVVFDLADIEEGAHNFIVEILPTSGEGWYASADGANPSGLARDILVDVTAPTVSAVQVPSDTLAPAGVLNIAEADDADARHYRLAADTEGAVRGYFVVNGTDTDTFDVVADSAAITAALAEGSNTIHLRAIDRVGNTSVGAGSQDLVEVSVTVDTIAPTAAFIAPTSSPIREGDPGDVTVSSDAVGMELRVFDGGTEVASGVVSDSGVTFTASEFGLLSDGLHTLTATVLDSAGNATTVATSPAEIQVDTTPPSVDVSAPANDAALTDDADISADAGVQIAVDFSTGDEATTWFVTRADGCDEAGTCQAAVTVASGAVTSPGADESALITLPAVSDINRFEITVGARDAVGNTVTETRRVTLVIQDCVVTLSSTGPEGWINHASCAAGTDCDATLSGSAAGTNCGAVDGLTLVRIADGTETEVGTLDSGAGDFVVTVAHGDALSYRVDATVDGLKVADSGPKAYTVDLDAPTLTVTPSSAATPPGQDLYGAANDVSPAPGFQLDARVEASDAHLGGGAIVSAVRTVDGVDAPLTAAGMTFPVAVDDDATSYDDVLAQLTLTDLADNTVTITVRDAAGNLASGTFQATVDTVPPAAVTLDAISAEDINARLPQVALSWTGSGDNGVDGVATSHDLRYSRQAITDAASFDAACRPSDIAHAGALPSVGASGDVHAYALHGPDPRDTDDPCKFAVDADSTWYFAVRASDDAGNVSPIAAANVQSTQGLRTRISSIQFTDSFAANAGLSAFATDFIGAGGSGVGDLDGDGHDDFVVGFNLSNSFCVMYGTGIATDVNIEGPSGPDHRCVIGTSSVVADSGANGLGALIEGLGDVNGDGFSDFGVSGKTASAAGFVAIYLGAETRPTFGQPDVLVRGLDSLSGAYGSFCGAGNFDGALHGPSNTVTADIAVGEPGSDRLRVIPGHTSWAAGQATVTIDFDVAGVEQAFGVHTFEAQFSQAAWFGNRCQAAGDLLPTPDGGAAAGDLLIQQANGDDSRLFVVPGRAFAPDTFSIVTDLSGAATTEDQRVVRLRQDPTDEGSFVTGWATTFQAGVDLDGDSVGDILVGHTGRSSSSNDGKAIHIFSGALIAAAAGSDLRVGTAGHEKIGRGWPGDNGTVVEADVNGFFRGASAVGNYDGWEVDGSVATPDLAIADKSATAITFRMNHAVDGGPEFLGLFPSDEFTVVNPVNSGAYTAGLWVAGGLDLDGNGTPETLIGTAKRRVMIVW